MSSYNTLVYMEQGGSRQVVASGGSLDVESGGELDVESGGALKIAGTQVTATAAELNAAADQSGRVVSGGTAATLAITQATHGERVVTLSVASGQAVTLPAATGSGTRLLFVLTASVTSNSTTIKVTGNDTMTGTALLAQDAGNTAVMFETAADSDTISFNGSTTAGIKGDSVELIDVATDLWWVRIVGSATGTEATPFSATVT
jgi:hypothetical protein